MYIPTWVNLNTAYTTLGYVGSTLLILSFLAQMISICKEGNTKNISYIFILLQFIVNILYVTYDISKSAWPLLVGNATIAFLLVIMAVQKFYYDRQIDINIKKDYDKLYDQL